MNKRHEIPADYESSNPMFDCEIWPECGCPDGSVSLDCPALNRMLENEGDDSDSYKDRRSHWLRWWPPIWVALTLALVWWLA